MPSAERALAANRFWLGPRLYQRLAGRQRNLDEVERLAGVVLERRDSAAIVRQIEQLAVELRNPPDINDVLSILSTGS
jgi:hypothetical protein